VGKTGRALNYCANEVCENYALPGVGLGMANNRKKARNEIAFPGLVLNSVHPKGGRDEQAASTAMMGHCSGAIGALAHIGQNIFCSAPMASTTHCGITPVNRTL